jgi:hypothetical protein
MKNYDLLKNQQTNGSFLDSNQKESLLASSLIASNLSLLSEKINKEKLEKYLLENKGQVFNFENNREINFLIAANILKSFPENVTGKEIAKIVKTLASIEKEEGGPYYNDKQQIDLGANIIIAYLLSIQEVDIPSLIGLIEDSIKKQSFKSELLNNEGFVIYLLSQFYKGEEKNNLIDLILKKLQNENIFNKILLSISLLNLKYEIDIKKIIDDIENNQESLNNQFQIFQGFKSTPDINFNFYIELISKYEQRNKELVQAKEEKEVLGKIIELAKNNFKNLSLDFAEISIEQIQKTITRNNDKQMSLMAYYTKKAFGKKGRNINDELVIEMGLMNVFFWTAFIIYDDFWDEDEDANPKVLPSANFYTRKYINFFISSTPENKKFINFFHNLMDKLDEANAWEVSHCRAKIIDSKFIIPESIPNYNDYEYKFNPSSGHILGPIALMSKIGYDLDSPEIQNFIAYFRNYLIAMQINDDAHDWEEDIKRGHLSTVVVMLLNSWKNNFPEKKEIDLIADLEKLQEIFWYEVITKASETALIYTKKSREALKKISIIEDYEPLEYFININERMAQKAIIEQKRSIEFLNEFQ